MGYKWPDEMDDFAEQWKQRINDNFMYGVWAEDWGIDFNGDLLLQMNDEYGPDDHYLGLNPLEGGLCEDYETGYGQKSETGYGFVIEGDILTWSKLFEKTHVGWDHIQNNMTFKGDETTFTAEPYDEANWEMFVEAIGLDLIMPLIEGFEDPDLSEYYGDTSYATQNSNAPVKRGSNSLKFDTDGTKKNIVSDTGLPSYPERGDTFRTWFRFSTAKDECHAAFGHQSGNPPESEQYEFKMNTGEFALIKHHNGDTTTLASQGVSLSSDTWYQLEIQWEEFGPITGRIKSSNGDMKGKLSASDSTFDAGGIGMMSSNSNGSSSTVYFDRWRRVKYIVVDDFEDQDLDEYQHTIVSGDVSAQTTTEKAKFGDASLKMTYDDGWATKHTLTSTEGLNTYPQRGEEFDFYFYRTVELDEDWKVGMSWCVNPDNAEKYQFRFKTNGHELHFWVVDADGNWDLLASKSISTTTDLEGSWIRVNVKFSSVDSSIVMSLYELGEKVGELSVAENNYDTGGIEWEPRSGDLAGGSVYFDHMEIKD